MIIDMKLSNYWVITILLILFMTAGSTDVPGDEVADLVKKGDGYYSKFDNLDALGEYERAYEQRPDDFEILNRLTRTYNDVGEDYKDKKSEKAVEYLEKGFKLAELMKEKYPQRPETYFYLAATRGNLALFRGGKEKVKLGRDVEGYARKAVEIDPYCGPAYVALGVYYREVANLNWFLKNFARMFFGGLPDGSNHDSINMLLKAREFLPSVAIVEYELGKTYREMGDEEKMKEHFNNALKLPDTDHRDRYIKSWISDILGNSN